MFDMGSTCCRHRGNVAKVPPTLKSSGFQPTVFVRQPIDASSNGIRKIGQHQSFLEMLNELSTLEDSDEEAAREIRRKAVEAAAARAESQPASASSGGIEINPSDETASQTLIGQNLTEAPDPGLIELKLIKN